MTDVSTAAVYDDRVDQATERRRAAALREVEGRQLHAEDLLRSIVGTDDGVSDVQLHHADLQAPD